MDIEEEQLLPLFVKFNTTVTIDSFNINSDNIYIIHKVYSKIILR